MFRAKKFILPVILLMVLGFGTWKLKESPAIWGDEGMLIELALNLARHGEMVTQRAPGIFISGASISTGYPVIYPVAASLKVFGIGLLQARGVMVIFMLLCVSALYLFVKQISGTRNAALASLLVATFPPFYGNGKNVLGEVPGLFFLILFLFCVNLLEQTDKHRRIYYCLAGLTAGLCVVTKPIFLVLLPSIVIALLISKKKIERDITSYVLFAVGLVLPILFWLHTQFQPNDSLQTILSFYANPYQLDNIVSVIRQNMMRFFTEMAPIYLLGTCSIWSLSIIPRLWGSFRKSPGTEPVHLAESISYVFTILILLAYLRTPGWYRYFFPAQIISFMFLPAALRNLMKRLAPMQKYASIPALFLTVIIGIQIYQTSFNSWVAGTYQWSRTKELETYFQSINPEKSFFVPPELVILLPNNNYYQYYDLSESAFGEEQLDKLDQGVPDILVADTQFWDANPNRFPRYIETARVGRYIFTERK